MGALPFRGLTLGPWPQEGGIGLGRLLEDYASTLSALKVEVCLAAGRKGVRGGVEGDDLVSDGRHRQRRVRGLPSIGLRLVTCRNSCEIRRRTGSRRCRPCR